MRSGAEIGRYAHPDTLPEAARALFAATPVGAHSFYATAAWYRLVVAHAMPPGATACFAVIGPDAMLFPLLQRADGGWQSLTTPYTCLYRPLFRAGISDGDIEKSGQSLARLCPSGLRLEALDADWPGLGPLLRGLCGGGFRSGGLRGGGLVALRFDHFGNWHTPVSDWPSYLASRDGALRETIRRRSARAARDPHIRLELFRHPGDLDRGIAAFEDVYSRSWKDPEPYPSFNAALIRVAAEQGVLRLGVMWQHTPATGPTGPTGATGATGPTWADTPARAIAVQYWVVTGPVACVLKLAHDEAARALSPGTVLTAWMIRSMLAEGVVTELDFGRGDDPYKQGWAALRRQRVGYLLVDPLSRQGLQAIARHFSGRILGKIRGHIRKAANWHAR